MSVATSLAGQLHPSCSRAIRIAAATDGKRSRRRRCPRARRGCCAPCAVHLTRRTRNRVRRRLGWSPGRVRRHRRRRRRRRECVQRLRPPRPSISFTTPPPPPPPPRASSHPSASRLTGSAFSRRRHFKFVQPNKIFLYENVGRRVRQSVRCALPRHAVGSSHRHRAVPVAEHRPAHCGGGGACPSARSRRVAPAVPAGVPRRRSVTAEWREPRSALVATRLRGSRGTVL